MNDNVIKFVVNKACYSKRYSRSMFQLEKALACIRFDKMYVNQLDCYRINIYFVGLGNSREINMNPSNQFKYSTNPRKSKIRNDILKEKWFKMELILKITVSLMNKVDDGKKNINENITFKKDYLLKN